MKMLTNTVNHIALLVRSVDRAGEKMADLGCKVGVREEWEGEGTAEIYVGEPDDLAKLLLIEAVKPGAYLRAMEKRGPGLHHVAIDVLALEEFVLGLAGTGWFLHPKSLETIKKTRTAWLARPDIGMLIEVQERKELPTEIARTLVTKIQKPMKKKEQAMISALGIETFAPSSDGCTWMVIGDKRIDLAELLK